MLITAAELHAHRERGSWRTLEKIAQTAIRYARQHGGESFNPKLGGGTRLMLAINHRISDDIDLFIDSSAWLPYVSPRLNDDLEAMVSSYQEDSDFVKLKFPEGEIDFIAGTNLLNEEGLWNPPAKETDFALEPPAEILAKKLFFCGWALTPRDIYDWAALAERGPNDSIPHKNMAKLLSAKLPVIRKSLERLLTPSPLAQHAWDSIRGVSRADIAATAQWGLGQIDNYAGMAR